jgi:hypothetical protein
MHIFIYNTNDLSIERASKAIKLLRILFARFDFDIRVLIKFIRKRKLMLRKTFYPIILLTYLELYSMR